MKIVLMRHGQPELDLHSLKSQRFSSHDLGSLVLEYESSDLNFSTLPSEQAIKAAQGCNIAVSSQLPRAVSSVRMLGVEEVHHVQKCFRESDLPYLNWQTPKLNFLCWAVIFRLCWLFGFAKNGEPIHEAKERARLEANYLSALANQHESVFLLGHGIMNRLIAKQLKSQGWKQTESTGESYWSYSVFEY
ncbi:hypothetical protein Q8W40_14830 [Vibrio penaeicida]|uniref:hypothetical protein n=1 Tax=Vibrio penaeicida TaxID=104609 RepID=UPI0027354741|nr:hypothetical protein [Vibrio penaeicida]MDP2573465.1 hypothetical protein [Vibrio penaeicida]